MSNRHFLVFGRLNYTYIMDVQLFQNLVWVESIVNSGFQFIFMHKFGFILCDVYSVCLMNNQNYTIDC